jgi:lipoprotein NlpI
LAQAESAPASGSTAAGEAPAGTATAPKPEKPIDPMIETLRPCLGEGSPSERALACTTLITSGRLTGRPLGAAYVGRGQAQAARNELTAAVDDFSQALKIDPEASDALYSRGAAYALIGRDDLALADFALLLKLVPGDPDTLYYRAQIYARQGKYEAAVSDLGAVLAKTEDFESRLQRAGFLIMLDRPDDALADLDKLVAATPDAPAALYNRGRAKQLKRDWAGAAADYTAAMKTRKDNPYAALRLTIVNALRGKPDATPLKEAAGAFPADQWPMPVVAFFQGKISEAELLQVAGATDSGTAAILTAETQYYLGAWSLTQKDRKAARSHFQAAVDSKADAANLELIDAGLELKRLQP